MIKRITGAIALLATTVVIAGCSAAATQQQIDNAQSVVDHQRGVIEFLEDVDDEIGLIAADVESRRVTLDQAIASIAMLLPDAQREAFLALAQEANDLEAVVAASRINTRNELAGQRLRLEQEEQRLAALRASVTADKSVENFAIGADAIIGSLFGGTGVVTAIVSLVRSRRDRNALSQTVAGIEDSKDFLGTTELEKLRNNLNRSQDSRTQRLIETHQDRLKRAAA